MAEREGFEPSTPVAQCTRFPGGRLRPLSHLSVLSKPQKTNIFSMNLVNKRNYIAKMQASQWLYFCKYMLNP